MVKTPKNDIGILGGSFDPVHKGHLAISNIAVRKLKLKKIYWILTKKNPFKKTTLFTLKERLNRAKNLTKKNISIKILFVDEVVKSNRSYDTIKYFLKKKKIKKVNFIIGTDILAQMHRWKNWKKLVKLTDLIVFSRKGYDRRGKESIVAKYLNKKNILFINNKHINISSTSVRKKYK